jgi:hypothetical protein
MGERVYTPQLGRFLQVDPIPGGSANNYDYVDQNPVNGKDLQGMSGFFGNSRRCSRNCGPSVGHLAKVAYRHINISVGLCIYTCYGLEIQDNHVTRYHGGIGFQCPGGSIDYK